MAQTNFQLEKISLPLEKAFTEADVNNSQGTFTGMLFKPESNTGIFTPSLTGTVK